MAFSWTCHCIGEPEHVDSARKRGTEREGALLGICRGASPFAGSGAKCAANGPTVKQTQVGFGDPPKFRVEVQNNCPMCPVINVHVECGSFNQSLVSPRLLKVVDRNDCVVGGGLPLPPLQKLSFTYSHSKYSLNPSSWDFQCE
ncbi:uncharacterized protein At1g05835 isoform X2 [Eucalyptus grandis]|uniref:uncharacterized protein At1g05835 isoform X2 n=1 Tax=Eucalyptus grandis TaxID=71139 RepID=UPI00192EFFEC|nr:uncharacterized protein At1g05835 isoform X2 [Eucalyptus grandis]